MTKNRAKALLFSILIILVVAGIYFGIKHQQRGPLTIRIGGLFALTGDGADWGVTEEKAARLAIKKANETGGIGGRKIELVVEDGPAEKVNDSVTAFRKLVNIDKVPVVIGPTWDDVAAALAPLADQTKVVVIAPDASSGVEAKKDFPFFFSIYTPEHPEMLTLVRYLKAKGVRTFSTVYNQDAFSQQWTEAFVTEAKRAGLVAVSEFPISDPDTKDFRTQIAKLRQTVPDVVYVEFTSQDTKGPFMRQAKELSLKVLIASSSTSETASTLEKYGTYIAGLIYAFPKGTPRQKQFLSEYKAAYGEFPKAPSAPYSYDAVAMVVEVLRRGARTGEEIRAKLLSLKDFQGVTAEQIWFNEKGRVQWPPEGFIIKTVVQGKFVEVTN